MVGVKLEDGEEIETSRVVLAVGHSARSLYDHLLTLGATLTPKDFALGAFICSTRNLLATRFYTRATWRLELTLYGPPCEGKRIVTPRKSSNLLTWHRYFDVV